MKTNSHSIGLTKKGKEYIATNLTSLAHPIPQPAPAMLTYSASFFGSEPSDSYYLLTQLFMPEAGHQVIVHHTNGLHQCIASARA